MGIEWLNRRPSDPGFDKRRRLLSALWAKARCSTAAAEAAPRERRRCFGTPSKIRPARHKGAEDPAATPSRTRKRRALDCQRDADRWNCNCEETAARGRPRDSAPKRQFVGLRHLLRIARKATAPGTQRNGAAPVACLRRRWAAASAGRGVPRAAAKLRGSIA